MQSLSFDQALDKFADKLDYMCKSGAEYECYSNGISLNKSFDQAEKLRHQELKHMIKVFGFQKYFNSCKKYFEEYLDWDSYHRYQPNISELKKQIAPAVKRLLAAKGKL